MVLVPYYRYSERTRQKGGDLLATLQKGGESHSNEWWILYVNMYVYVSMHSLQKGGESPSFHQELVASSQVMCIYTGTHQLFPTRVLAEGVRPAP